MYKFQKVSGVLTSEGVMYKLRCVPIREVSSLRGVLCTRCVPIREV